MADDDTYLMMVDGKVQAVDLGPMCRRSRAAIAAARADLIGQAADLFADPAFDIGETYAAAEAAMPGAMVNAAAYIGLILREVELGAG